jgi:DUF4097 and DUF4098 domain-containing protein YvlB
MWIIGAIALVTACCCVVAVAAVALASGQIVRSVRLGLPVELSDIVPAESSRIEHTFAVDGAPTLEIDNFAGSVTVHAGASGEIRVVAVKRASRQGDLDRIEVNLSQEARRVIVETRKPSTLNNAMVRLEISTPTDTRLELRTGASDTEVRGLAGDVVVFTGAGSVRLSDLEGDIEAYTGAGTVEVREARGRVRLESGAGTIYYRGQPEGSCEFVSGAGTIHLVLPSDLDMEVDLSSGMGSVDVDHSVAGRVTRRDVKGVVGSGENGSIHARTGLGSIQVDSR